MFPRYFTEYQNIKTDSEIITWKSKVRKTNKSNVLLQKIEKKDIERDVACVNWPLNIFILILTKFICE